MSDALTDETIVAAFECIQELAEDEITRLRHERDQLRGILMEIARRECGIPGHSVAVGCGCPERAREALDATTPEEASPE